MIIDSFRAGARRAIPNLCNYNISDNTTASIVNSSCYVGVEIEIESKNKLLPNPPAKWTSSFDGSLRGEQSMEYKLIRPLSGKNLEAALKDISSALNNKGVFSYRTSTHIHLDVNRFTHNQLGVLVFLSILYEPLLIQYCADHRKNNHFCTEWSYEYIKEVASKVLTHNKFLTLSAQYRGKIYAGCSLHPLEQYGSVEYRYLEGTQKYLKIRNWINILQRIWSAAYKTEAEVNLYKYITSYLGKISQKGPKHSIEELFKTQTKYLDADDFERNYVDYSRKAQLLLGGIPNVWNRGPRKAFRLSN